MNTGFKEWQVVCDAMARGEQSIILRKGGIAEGREGFQFKHPEFYLFPTLFHEQAARIRPEFRGDFSSPGEGSDTERAEITVELLAKIVFHRVIRDWETVKGLERFHIWTEEEVRKRFDWDSDKDPGISLACVRVYRLAEPWTFSNERKFGGCRSWIELPVREAAAAAELTPVLDDDEAAHVAASVSEWIDRGRT